MTSPASVISHSKVSPSEPVLHPCSQGMHGSQGMDTAQTMHGAQAMHVAQSMHSSQVGILLMVQVSGIGIGVSDVTRRQGVKRD